MPHDFLDNMFGLGGQVAVVIGGTGVLGGSLAVGLAQAGATVVVAGRDFDRGQECCRVILDLGGKAEYLPVDATERASVESLLGATLAEFGQVDMLINCAGVNSAEPYFEISDETFERVLATNLVATHLGCQIFGRHMSVQAGGGSILNIGSVSADVPLSRVFAYSASKAAVVNLTRNVARELAKNNVRVNVLCPGFFPAEQNRKVLTVERVEAILAHTPQARFGDPHELVGAALLLLSRAAGSFITGAELYVDGGFTAMSI
ncbi:MAG: SDR family oxidoreductase [Planctomycetia bacterium]|nr:SDR family oxidoreductase [Planctomycetia bacterium]